MGPKRKYDDLTELSSAGSSGDGGGGGGGDDRPSKAPRLPPVPPPTAQSPSGDQTALPTSPPPADKDAVELEEGEIEDDADSWEEEEDDQDSDEELGGSFHAIPVSTQGYLSLKDSWKQLLDGKRTYLRPPKDCQMIFGGNFRCPDARPTALGPEVRILCLEFFYALQP